MLRSLLFILFSAAFIGCVTNVEEQSVRRQAEVSINGVSSVYMSAGSYDNAINIFGDTNKTILATADVKLWSKDVAQANKILQNLSLRWSLKAGEATLSTDYPGTDKELTSIGNVSVYTNRDINFRIENSANDINITGMRSTVDVNSTSGNSRIETEGRVIVKTTSGKVTGYSVLGGSIESTSGDIDFDVTSKDFESLVVKQTSGHTYLRIARNTRVTFLIEAQGASSSATVDYGGNYVKYSDGKAHTIVVNGGGKVVSVTSTSGDITIRDF